MVRAPGGADAHAHAAAHAVQGRLTAMVYLYTPLPLPAFTSTILAAAGALGGLFLGQSEGTDGSVGADIGAVVALDALGGVPGGNGHGHAALLISGSALLELCRPHEARRRKQAGCRRPYGPRGSGCPPPCFTSSGGPVSLVVISLVLGVSPVGGHVELLVSGSARRRWPCGSCPQCPGPSSGRSGWRRPSCTGWPRPRA